jgi:integrase
MTRRRTKRTGSLRHLGPDRWQVTITKKGAPRMSRVFTAGDKVAAELAAPAVIAQLMADRARAANTGDAERDERRTWTVERYAAYYLAEWASRTLEATTRERYRQVIEKQIGPHLGRKLMSEVTVMDVVKMQTALAADGQGRNGGRLSGATITKVHNVLGAIFTFAVDVQKDLPENPVHDANARVTRPESDEWREDADEKARALDVSEVARFVELARAEESTEVFTAILLSARLGLRRGEALALQWRDIDFDTRRATIRRAVSQAPAGERLSGEKRVTTVAAKPIKTKKVRYIPIGDQLASELRAVQRRQQVLRLAADPEGAEAGRATPRPWRGGKTPQNDYITAGPNGAVLEPEHYTSRFRALAKRHKIAVMPHVLRHSWCSQMISLGYDAVTIASMSGHSPDVLLRIYGHAFDARKREAVDAYDEAWGAVAKRA